MEKTKCRSCEREEFGINTDDKSFWDFGLCGKCTQKKAERNERLEKKRKKDESMEL